MKQINIWARCPSVADCGVFYYRQYLPLLEARKNKKINFSCYDFTWGERDYDKEPEIADVIEVKIKKK